MTKQMTYADYQKLTEKKGNKYGNKPVKVDGMCFDSQKEHEDWCDLMNLQRAGEISDLRRQVRYDLQIKGTHICDYIADFVYYDKKTGCDVVADSKGVRTEVFRLKSKMMKAIYGIEVVEI